MQRKNALAPSSPTEGATELKPLDETDLRVLRLLQNDGRMPSWRGASTFLRQAFKSV